MSGEEFEIVRESLQVSIDQRDASLADEFGTISSEIFAQKYVFDRKQRKLEALAQITKEDLAKHFDKVFFSNEKKRLDIESLSPSQAEQ